ncbi:unnamed protein product [Eruca vesicaria subsp. sativa]|uniref:Uncharacterized protein n=1 Tax=Eruca vesicaria subsp. sativa TaxID=29727 RepID=A0ABC8JNW6_ERUVS|nr:unnamed protein product [Eruca vesicaria subsp. sativa]
MTCDEEMNKGEYGESERKTRGDDTKDQRNRSVEDDKGRGPDVEDDDKIQREHSGANDGVGDPTPAARGFTGIERDGLHC